VRNLERQIANVCRKVAKDIVMGETVESFKAEGTAKKQRQKRRAKRQRRQPSQTVAM